MQNCPVQKAPLTGENLIIPAATDMVIRIRIDELTSGKTPTRLQTHVKLVGKAK